MKTTTKLNLRQDPVPSRVRQIGSLVQSGDLDKAESAALELLNSHPKRPEVHNILGVIYIQQKKRNRAVAHFEFAVKAEPQNSVYLNNLGRLYLDMKLIELALPFLHNALTIDPNLVPTLLAIANYFMSVGQAARALPYLERARKLVPRHPTVLSRLADSYDAFGRKAEANALYRELLRERPNFVEPLYHLSRSASREESLPLIEEAERMLGSVELEDRDRGTLHTALGFMSETAGRYPAAFAHFDQANRLNPVAFDLEGLRAWVGEVIELFTPAFFRKYAGWGCESSLPVLVVGMPRSGTTLTEQMIASHGQAAGAGEITRIGFFGGSLNYGPRKDIGKFPPSLDAQGAKGLREMGENYVNLLRFHAPQAQRIVDKMPHNFQNLGLVALLCPRARIIHCSRSPIDTCLSCFQNPLNDGHSYSRDLGQLGLYYREYARLMDHWRKVLPLPVYELSYERMTADFAAEARKVIDFIGLPWDEACLKFYEAGSTVRTFSRQQVRNPVYKSSVERWRRYETELQPLLSALGDLV